MRDRRPFLDGLGPRVRKHLRYVDDFALFADSERQLDEWRGRIDTFLARRRLKLHPRKTFIAPTAEPAAFLGYELHPGGWRRMPEANVDRAHNRLRGIKDRLTAGTITKDQAGAQVQAWKAQADLAEHLQRAMSKGLPEEVRKRPRGQRKRRRKKSGGD